MVVFHDAIETIQKFFYKKKNKNLFLFEKTKKLDEKDQVFSFFEKNGFFSTLIVFQFFLWFYLDRTIWNKWRHYQFDWVCAAHLE